VDISDALGGGLRIVRDWGLPLMMALAAVGVISMALIQAFKDIVPVHATFNRSWIQDWLGPVEGPAYQQFLQLATGGDARPLFHLPVSGLMGQVSMAVRIALLFPNDFHDLLKKLVTTTEGLKDLEAIRQAARPGSSPAASVDIDQARVRVGHFLERAIDAKQVAMAHDWEWWNKGAGYVVSMIVTAVAFYSYFVLVAKGAQQPGWLLVTVLPLSIVAGFIAPIAKDLVKALESVAKK
jgi:hypothetical protein